MRISIKKSSRVVTSMIKLITFLGNPGRQHEQTRHNIGWKIADALLIISDIQWQNKFKGLYGQKNINQEKLYFLKPQTFMNKSGESVQVLMHFFKLSPQELLIVHDDIELDFGFVGFKKGGGLAGHNGLRSIVSVLGTRDFYRFRIGVSRPQHGNVSSYVLSKFSSDEQIVLPILLERAADAMEYCISEGIESALKSRKKEKIV